MKLASLICARSASHSARILGAIIVLHGGSGSGSTAQAATISLVPVSATGNFNIVGDRIDVESGATVTLEIRVAGWAPSLLKTGQATIDSSGYSSGASGTLAPLTAPTVGDGAFIDKLRSDYVFFGESSIEAVDTATPNYRWGATRLSGGTADPGSSRYLGTLKLVVSGDAAGVFTVGFFPPPDSFLADDNNESIPMGGVVPAEISVAQCVVDGDCDDNVFCTIDTCDAGICTNTPSDAFCDDGLFCNGVEYCDPGVDCRPQGSPCESALCNEVLNRCEPTVLYLDAAAVGLDTGLSWENAYRRLQDALLFAAAVPSVTQVWVAKGTYKPTEQTCVVAGDCDPGGSACIGGQCVWTTPRGKTFQLLNGVALYGGFIGGSLRCIGGSNDGAACTNDAQCPGGICGGFETLLSQRDPVANPTILSGDLDGDDGANFANYAENSYHVLKGGGTNSTAVLDGFIVSGGNANGPFPDDCGGGMNNTVGSPSITGCVFERNSGGAGGICNETASPTITRCTFRENRATDTGGGIYGFNSVSSITDCLFTSNTAASNGGGIVMLGSGSSVKVTRCTFSANTASSGGGLNVNVNVTATITNCDFSGNSANNGGAMFNWNNAAVTNCSFHRNTAAFSGGGIANRGTGLSVINSTLAMNNAGGSGGGLHNNSGTSATNNCVLWGNTDLGGTDESAQVHLAGGSVTVSQSIIQGWTGALGGVGNSGTDPRLRSASGGDFRLAPGSPAIDAGTNPAVPFDSLDLDGDLNTSERIPIDLGGNPRFFDDPATPDTGVPINGVCAGGSNNGLPCTVGADCPGGTCACAGVPSCTTIVDIGAYEYFTDCNDNGIVDECDLTCGGSCGAVSGCGSRNDCNANGVPDECDIAACAGNPSCRACVGGSNHGATCEEPADCPGGACANPNDDCNQNGVPDGCDIGGISLDVAPADGVPDECVTTTGGGGTINWSDGGNWPLAGKFPDNIDPVNGVPQRYVTMDGATILVDRTIQVNALRLINGARLLVIQLDTAKRRGPQTAAGDLEVIEKLSNGGIVDVANNRSITVGDELIVAANGIYRAAPGAGADGCPSGVVCASLTAGSVSVQPGDCAKALFGGEVALSGQMQLISTGTVTVVGSPSPFCPPAAGSVADSRGITPPPKFTVRNIAATYASAAVVSGAVDSFFDSSDAIVVTGDFDNGAQFPSIVDWTLGTIRLEGPTPHYFEAAGLDLGPSAEGFLTDADTLFDTAQHTNFSLGRLVVGPGTMEVHFVNRKVNTAGMGDCAEAVYVDVVETFGPVPVLFHLNNVRVYYRGLTGPPPIVVPLGCGAFLPICDVPAPAVAETLLNAAGAMVPSVKNRFLSFSGGGAGLLQAVRVRFVSLPGAFNVFNGTTAWVGLPQTASELPGKSFTDPIGGEAAFHVARLVDAPVYADWSTFDVVHVRDERIIPSRKPPGQPLEPAVYAIQLVSAGCDIGSEAGFSPALSITNAVWGDVASLASGQFRAADGSIEVTADVLAVLAKFGNSAGAPIKVRAEIVGTGPTGPQANLTGTIDISDVLAVLGAFSGGSYPFAPPTSGSGGG